MSTLACGLLQMNPAAYRSAHDYQVTVAARVSTLARNGARLIVLPAFAVMAGASLERLQPEHGTPFERIAAVADSVGIGGYGNWLDFFAASALSNRVYLCPGSYWEQTDGGFIHRAPLFSPDGDIIGEALQTHSTEAEERAGLLCDVELPVFHVENHIVGMELATDVWYPEVGRIHALQGADILIALTAMPSPYTVWKQTAGLWQISQQNQVFGIEASLRGSWLGTAYQGRSRAFAPVEVTDDGRGVLAEITSESERDEFVVELEVDSLQKARSVFPIFEHFNTHLYSERLQDAYLTGRTVKIAPSARERRS